MLNAGLSLAVEYFQCCIRYDSRPFLTIFFLNMMHIYPQYLGWHELQIVAVKYGPILPGKWIFSELWLSWSVWIEYQSGYHRIWIKSWNNISGFLELLRSIFTCRGAFSQFGIDTFTWVGNQNTSSTAGKLSTSPELLKSQTAKGYLALTIAIQSGDSQSVWSEASVCRRLQTCSTLHRSLWGSRDRMDSHTSSGRDNQRGRTGTPAGWPVL